MPHSDSPIGTGVYRTADGRPALQKSWIAYIDALGTKALMESLTDDQLQSHLDLVDRVVDEALGGDESNYTVLTFSDNIAIALPHDENELNINRLIKSAGLYQYAMTIDGVFVRGGLSTGILHANERSVLGPALINAVVLEEQIAVHPRILLDAAATENAMRVLDHPQNLCVDADGRVFVDYLSVKFLAEWVSLSSDTSGEVGVDARLARLSELKVKALKRHRDAIAQALESQHSSNPGVREKYVWAAHYHNYCCRRELLGRGDYDPYNLVIERPLSRFEFVYPRKFRQLDFYATGLPGSVDLIK